MRGRRWIMFGGSPAVPCMTALVTWVSSLGCLCERPLGTVSGCVNMHSRCRIGASVVAVGSVLVGVAATHLQKSSEMGLGGARF